MLPVELTITKDGDNHVIHGEVDWNGEGKLLSLNYWYGKRNKKTAIKQLVGITDLYPGGTEIVSEINHTWNPGDEREITYQLVAFDQEGDYGIDQETVKL